MKRVLLFFICGLVLSSYSKEESELQKIKTLSSYWHFDYLNFDNRGLYFVFYDEVKRDNKFDLVFEWSINGNDIIVQLIDLKDMGPCPEFPSPDLNLDKRCTSRGFIFIPEDKIPVGDYNFIIKTEALNVVNSFNFDGTKYTIVTPDLHLFSVHKKEIYPIPKNILMGNIQYYGDENTIIAQDFISDLNDLGFNNTVVPNFNKIGINEVDSTGVPYIYSWPPDFHSRSFVCTLSNNFKQAFDLAIKYYNENPTMNIVLRSSNGDSADLNQIHGISFKFN